MGVRAQVAERRAARSARARQASALLAILVLLGAWLLLVIRV
jgi:hypothetical protein